MDPKELQAGVERMKAMVEPWHKSLNDPKNSQDAVLAGIVKDFLPDKVMEKNTAPVRWDPIRIFAKRFR